MKTEYGLRFVRHKMMGTMFSDSDKPPSLAMRGVQAIGRAVIVAVIVVATCAAAYVNPQAFSTGFAIGYVGASIGARR